MDVRIRRLAGEVYGQRGEEVTARIGDLLARHRSVTGGAPARGVVHDPPEHDPVHDLLQNPAPDSLGESVAESGPDPGPDRAEAPAFGGPPAATPRRMPTERDLLLITYADQVRDGDRAPLAVLRELLARRAPFIPGVHLLPFFPASSDDGFSVIDYLTVDPAIGDWDDVHALAGDVELMFDAVINHVSAHSAWFRGFLAGDDRYARFPIVIEDDPDLSAVVRPRTSPLLTEVETAHGPRRVWTTFSADQIDLDYTEPDVLLEMLAVLLEYVRHGASLLRLDAVTYLWKEIGTSCVHLPNTHRVVQLIRAVLDEAAPRTLIITETNVPHDENVSYFGDGHGEAQLVYNFALPPLVLHTFRTGDASALTAWASTLTTPSTETCFFNLLASHDGIGLRGAEGILPPRDLAALAESAERHGGLVSYRSTADGPDQPYELNISLFDALSDPAAGEDLDVQIARFRCAHAIAFALAGMPGLYVHSLFGSGNDLEGVARTGASRSINRARFDLATLESELDDSTGRRRRVLASFERLITVRAAHDAFDPAASQRVLGLDPRLVVIARGEGAATVTCLHNVSGDDVTLDLAELVPSGASDLLADRPVTGTTTLAPYEVLWIRSDATVPAGG